MDHAFLRADKYKYELSTETTERLFDTEVTRHSYRRHCSSESAPYSAFQSRVSFPYTRNLKVLTPGSRLDDPSSLPSNRSERLCEIGHADVYNRTFSKYRDGLRALCYVASRYNKARSKRSLPKMERNARAFYPQRKCVQNAQREKLARCEKKSDRANHTCDYSLSRSCLVVLFVNCIREDS